jgi:hypothetical protein
MKQEDYLKSMEDKLINLYHSTIRIDIQYSSDDDKRELEPYLDKAIQDFATSLKTLKAGELTITKL